MSRFTRSITRLLPLGLLIVVIGCEQPKKEDLAAGQKSAEERIKELERQLADADGAKVAAEEDALALRNERDRLKAELAKKTTSPVPGWEAVPGGVMKGIEGSVLFDSGKAVIKPGGKQILDEVAATITKSFGNHEIYVFGHTDAEPIKKSAWKDNYELSCQRALAVVRHLMSKGVTAYVAACGWGEHRPVAPNPKSGRQSANRRVEVFAMIPQTPVKGSASTGQP